MNCSIKKLVSIYLAGSVSSACCFANNVSDTNQTSDVSAPVSKISDETWKKVEKMTSDDIKKLFYISYDMLPFQYREKLDRPGYKIKKGFNIQAASGYNKSSVQKFAEKNSYKFIEVDLGLKASVDRFKDFVDNRTENEVIIVYIYNIRCSDINSYYEDILGNLKNHRFGIFVNCFENCNDKKCLEHKRMKSLKSKFEFSNVSMDWEPLTPRRKDNVDSYYNIIKEFLKRLESCLDGNLNLTSEQINAIFTVFGEYYENYDKLEQLFVDAFSTLSSKKTFDFDSIFTILMSYTLINPERYSWNEIQMKSTSIHEMGHAFVRKYLKLPVTTVLMNADFSGATFLKISDFDQDKKLDYKGYENWILVCLAGRAAQDLLDTGSDLGCTSDMEKAYTLALQALKTKDPTFELKDEAERKKLVFDLFEKLQRKVENIILDNEDVIRKLADELMNKPDVNGIKFIIGSEFDRLYEKFMKESEQKKKFLEKNQDAIDEILSKISQDPEMWNSIKSSFGIKSEENKDEEIDKKSEDKQQSDDEAPSVKEKN